MRVTIFFLALSLATIGCRKTVIHTTSVATTPDTLIAGTMINSAGTWSAHTAQDNHQLDVSIRGNSVSWSISSEEKHPGGATTRGSGESGMTLSSPSDPWFIFVESPQRLWFFNGSGDLSYNLSGHGGSRSGPAIFTGRLLPTNETIPADVVRHLPPELQKLFPPVAPEEGRPSF